MQTLNSQQIRMSFSHCSHGIAVVAESLQVYCSGRRAVAVDDSFVNSFEAQTRLCFENIAAVLGEADLALSDIVRINARVADRRHMNGDMRARHLCRRPSTNLKPHVHCRLRATGVSRRIGNRHHSVTAVEQSFRERLMAQPKKTRIN